MFRRLGASIRKWMYGRYGSDQLNMLLLVLAVAVLGGGAAFYFKVYRPKQQAATEPEEDYGEELEDYDGEEDGPPWDEDEDENEDTEDGE